MIDLRFSYPFVAVFYYDTDIESIYEESDNHTLLFLNFDHRWLKSYSVSLEPDRKLDDFDMSKI